MKRKMIKNIAIAMALAISLSIIPNKTITANATWTVVDYSTMTDADLSAADKALMHENNWLTRYVAGKRGKTFDTLTLSDFLSITDLSRSTYGYIGLPQSIKFMTNLTSLDLSDNQITTIPPEIGNLTKLTSLCLNGSQLTSIPPEIGNLKKLIVLQLKGNQLTSVPPEIGNLTNVTQLWLDYNRITSLPPEIGNLTNMTKLRLSNNQLTSLPPEIGNLTKLSYSEITLGNNFLTSEILHAKYVNNFISSWLCYNLAFNSDVSALEFPVVGDKINISDIIEKNYGTLTTTPLTMSQSVVDQLQVVADDPSIIDSTGKVLKSGTTNIRVQLPNNPSDNPSGITQTKIQVTVSAPPDPEPPTTPTINLSKSSDTNVTFGLEDTLQLTLTSNTLDFGAVTGITTSESSNLIANVKSSLPYDVDFDATDNFTNLDDVTAAQIPISKLGVNVDDGDYSKFTGVNNSINLISSASSTRSLGDSGKDYQIKFNLDKTIGFDKGKYTAPLTITATQK